MPALLYGGAFLADTLPRFPGNHLHEPPPEEIPDTPETTPGWSANDLPFWGDFEQPCPKIRKVAKAADCCTEISVTLLSHGILKLRGDLRDRRDWAPAITS